MTNTDPNSGMGDLSHDESSVPSAVELPSSGVGQPQRPARALLGWLPPGLGELMLVSNQMGVPLTDEHRARLQAARDAVAARPIGIDQVELVTPLPPRLASHLARLQVTVAGAQMIQNGWNVAMVDLDRVVAFQPSVFTDTAIERVANIDADDLEAIAELTLPTAPAAPITCQFQPHRQAYIFASPNPNLKVIGNFAGPVAEANGGPVFGFMVAEHPSFVQVVQVGGRYFLTDGYHRAFGLLSRGITRVPAFVRDLDRVEGVPAGMLPPDAWLSDRPPLLRDYGDDTVAERVLLPATQKMIVIQALELDFQHE